VNPYEQMPHLSEAQAAAMETAQTVLELLGFEIRRMALIVELTHPSITPPGDDPDAALNMACFHPHDDWEGHEKLMQGGATVVKQAAKVAAVAAEMPEGVDPNAN